MKETVCLAGCGYVPVPEKDTKSGERTAIASKGFGAQEPGYGSTAGVCNHSAGKVYEKHKEAGEVLRGIIEGVTAFTRHEVGMYKGFQVFVQKDMMGPVLFLQGEKEYSVELKAVTPAIWSVWKTA